MFSLVKRTVEKTVDLLRRWSQDVKVTGFRCWTSKGWLYIRVTVAVSTHEWKLVNPEEVNSNKEEVFIRHTITVRVNDSSFEVVGNFDPRTGREE